MIQEDHTWTLMVSKSGQLSTQSGTLLKEDLEGVLEEELRTNPQVSLIIEADEGFRTWGGCRVNGHRTRGGYWFSSNRSDTKVMT